MKGVEDAHQTHTVMWEISLSVWGALDSMDKSWQEVLLFMIVTVSDIQRHKIVYIEICILNFLIVSKK